ncbi:MAG: phosphoglycerate dehydrogenase [Oscillospiraceae bacterium]|nr:phosphoglycerate dehydrogenase [Oscillospiraceae bacterium]
MYKIQTMNKIAPRGTDILAAAGCQVGPDLTGADALLVRSAKLHDVEFDPSLLCIGRAGIGVDNIPLDRCTAANIAVFNTPGANAEGVKELLVCALTLASRDIIGGESWVRSLADQGDKLPAAVEKGKSAFAGPELNGKKLGVIGLGAIGSKVANAALKLDMEVYGYDPFLSVEAAWSLSSKVHHVTDLDTLYRTCDYFTMHIHATKETFHYMDAAAFAKMKPGARIMNFARGELVDDDALLEAIRNGQVAKYVTDFPNAKIVGQKGVIALPHLGASTPESEEKCAAMAARELLDYLENGNVTNSVNFPAASLERMGDCRLCILHDNKPGMLNQFLEKIAGENANVEHMLNKARGDIAYTLFDITPALSDATAEALRAIPGVRLVRLLK